jgi:hypothetical protein
MALVQHLAVSDEPDGSAAADQRGAPVPGGLPTAEPGSGHASGAAHRRRPIRLNSSSARRGRLVPGHHTAAGIMPGGRGCPTPWWGLPG